MNQPYNPFDAAMAAYMSQMQQMPSADQIDADLKDQENDWDDGALVPIFKASKIGKYTVRIWPNLPPPNPEDQKSWDASKAYQWWFLANLYDFMPAGLARGFSPKTFGQPDAFEDWLKANVPYDKDDDVSKEFWQTLLPKKRVLAWVLVRNTPGYEPNKLYLWSLAYLKVGFQVAVEPAIREWAGYNYNPVDLNAGFDSYFEVIGEKRNWQMTGFRWMNQQQPGPACDPQLMRYLYETQYRPLGKTHKVVSQDQLAAMIEYFKPIVEMSLTDPAAHVKPTDPNAHAKAVHWAKARAQHYAMSGSQTPANLPPATMPVPPLPTTPQSPAHSSGTPFNGQTMPAFPAPPTGVPSNTPPWQPPAPQNLPTTQAPTSPPPHSGFVGAPSAPPAGGPPRPTAPAAPSFPPPPAPPAPPAQ